MIWLSQISFIQGSPNMKTGLQSGLPEKDRTVLDMMILYQEIMISEQAYVYGLQMRICFYSENG